MQFKLTMGTYINNMGDIYFHMYREKRDLYKN